MVSFQCDACQDVVKKPKLDNHSYRCHASFTCVDCSKTFYSSGEWKGHTQCISEAEKYQKALYKGKKNNGASGPRGAKTQNVPSNTLGTQAVTQTATKASDLEEGHGSQPSSSNKQDAPAVDGMDVDLDAAVESVERIIKDQGPSEGKRKRKSEALSAPKETPPATVNVEEGEKKKKRKRADADGGERTVRSAEKSKASDESNVDDASRATSGVGDIRPVDEKREKKKRKDKKSKKLTGADSKEENSARVPETAPSSSAPAERDGESVDIKHRKRKAEDNFEQTITSPEVIPGEQDASPVVESSESKKRKRKDKSKKRDKKDKEGVQVHDDADETPKNSATEVKQKPELLTTEEDAHQPSTEHAREKDDKKKRKEKRKNAGASTS